MTSELRRLTCNTIIQLHFNYACSAIYPHLLKNIKKKLQIIQSKHIWFYLKPDKMYYFCRKEFNDKLTISESKVRAMLHPLTHLLTHYNNNNIIIIKSLFNRDLNRGCLVYMFSLCLSGSKCLIDLQRHIRVSKVFSCK